MIKQFTFCLTVVMVFLTLQIRAQAPQKFNYQAVCRDNTGSILATQPVMLRITIHDLSALGNPLFKETHSVNTNSFGLVNIPIGGGTLVSGNFLAIPWGTGDKYIEVELSTNGGSTYSATGTPQLLSVPYALYANQANVSGSTGPTGLQGATGPTGPSGTSGTPGTQGSTGPTGPSGANGPPGAQGPTGIDGATGPSGADGATGPSGPSGADGAQGATGPQGITGPLVPGTTGQTLYFDGTSWVASSVLYNDGTNAMINGGFGVNKFTNTGPLVLIYNATLNDFFINCNNTPQNLILNLPAAASCPGKIYVIKRTVPGNAIKTTITPLGLDKIDGNANMVLTGPYRCAMIISDGTNWWVISTM